ncbi:extracellular solute-binding protein [Streptococcus pneumoniae]|nr:extracellular solute-binding protein [Streptococcus pneumoniae]
MQQFDTAINTGTVDPDKAIPELMEKLKSEGAYEKVLNEMQKQWLFVNCSGLKSAKLEKGQILSFLF